MYTCQTNSTNYENKTFICTEQIIWTAKTNMYTCRKNFRNYQNKKLYVPNKLYELTKQILEEERIFYTIWTEDIWKLFSPKSGSPYPSLRTHPSYVFRSGYGGRTMEGPKNRNLESVSAKIIMFLLPNLVLPTHTNRPSSARRRSNLRSARTPNYVCPMLSTIHTSPQSSYLSATEPRRLACPKPLTPSQAVAALHVVKPSRSMVGHRKGTRRPSCFPVLASKPGSNTPATPSTLSLATAATWGSSCCLDSIAWPAIYSWCVSQNHLVIHHEIIVAELLLEEPVSPSQRSNSNSNCLPPSIVVVSSCHGVPPSFIVCLR
jgi:hypothetical protein